MLKNTKKREIKPNNRGLSAALKLFGAGLFCLLLWHCGPDNSEIARQKIKERTEAFRAKKSAECREKLFRAAEKTVDSLLLAEAQQQLRDSLIQSRPGRPLKPVPVPPIDSLTVKPLFNQ